MRVYSVAPAAIRKINCVTVHSSSSENTIFCVITSCISERALRFEVICRFHLQYWRIRHASKPAEAVWKLNPEILSSHCHCQWNLKSSHSFNVSPPPRVFLYPNLPADLREEQLCIINAPVVVLFGFSSVLARFQRIPFRVVLCPCSYLFTWKLGNCFDIAVFLTFMDAHFNVRHRRYTRINFGASLI